jgi:hypothetical protein
VPDITRLAAIRANRSRLLRPRLVLPAILCSIWLNFANARTVAERLPTAFSLAVLFWGIIVALLIRRFDLGPVPPLPGQFGQTAVSSSVIVDSSRQDLPRVALFRIGELSDLFALSAIYAIFTTGCALKVFMLQSRAIRWAFRGLTALASLYVLGGDGAGDLVTLVASLRFSELFIFVTLSLIARQRYR